MIVDRQRLIVERFQRLTIDRYSLTTNRYERWTINNQSLEYVVRPDFLVRKNGVKYFAEVKTGNAAEINNINTRRQLLEYSFLSDFNTTILVDMEQKKIIKVNFRNI